MQGGFRIARIAGIEIGVHYTWLIAFVLVTWTLAQGFFPQSYPGWDAATYWATGVAAALLLFGSVLVHELAHSFVAQARGVPVRSITLFIFGGVSAMETEAQTARDELWIAAVGPATSAVLAAAFWALLQVAQPKTDPLAATLGYLALVNAMLAAFNLLPGFPLDGGRVLRAILWLATRSFSRATRLAAGAGQVFAFLLIGLGVFQALGGNFLGGIWIAFIGWFLMGAADASRREVEVREAFQSVRVEMVMDRAPETVAQSVPVEELVYDCFLGKGRRALPVCQDDRILGIVTLTDVRKVDRDQWATARVADIMTRHPLHAVQPESAIAEALRLMAEGSLNQVLVIKGEKLVGLLSRSDIIRYLQFRSELGLPPSRSPSTEKTGPTA